MKKLGILLSGRGSNFEAIAAAVRDGRVAAEIAAVISNRPSAAGLEKARALGLPAECIPSKGKGREEYDRAVAARLKEAGVDIVCLAGFMRLLSPYFVAEFPRKILNIHPSLLPSFPGLDAQRQALEHGVRVAGCTVHFVDEHLDSGPIVEQAVVSVLDDDDEETLAARILKEEHRIYPVAIQTVLDGEFEIVGRRVVRRRS